MSEDIVIWQQGYVRDNQLYAYNKDLQKTVLTHYNENQVEFCIRKKKKKVSNASHAYYRGIIIPVILQTEMFGGWNEIDLHKLFASLFLRDVKVREIKNKVYLVDTILSTAEINQERMNRFIEDVRNWLRIEHSINTPDPEKNDQKNQGPQFS